MPEQTTDPAYRGNLSRLLDKVRSERGLDLSQYRENYVARRVAVRLNALGLHTYKQYSAYLDGNPEEYAKLLDTLTINVTQFFRDPTVYALFRDQVVPSLLATKKSRKQRLVRLWSAGCATGEEPYSLAMSMLDGIVRTRSNDAMLSVIGTDIDRKALAVAKRGEYSVRLLNQIPTSDRHRYVDVDGEVFRMKPEIAKVTRFQYLNLFEDPPINGIDVVFCRNVFIYFNHGDQSRLIESFWEALTRGGYLVLGRSERLAPALAKRFELVSGRERVYRKPLGLS
ncbi:MAG: protein-glutamate O-methyltransferase CheR [Coriobacteriia bacterium]|nr:protein-glutamate O-methyltransferase CheR [Coriobacteriia bacterium]